jgi:PEP-CTERM/exosortase A-associated glycosyltransferase
MIPGSERGMRVLLDMLTRLPVRLRRIMLRPLARRLARSAERWPASVSLAELAFVVRRSAGPRAGLDEFMQSLLQRPRTPPDGVRRLIVAAWDAGLLDVAASALWRIPDDHSDSLEPARSHLAFVEGRYRDAVAHGQRGVDAGIPRAQSMVEVASSHLAVLDPAWTPALGPSAARLQTLRGGQVPGRVLHVVSVALPQRLAGYTVRTQNVIESQIGAGLDAQAIVRSGFPKDARDRPGTTDRIGRVAYHRVEPLPWTGRPDEMIARVVAAATEVVAQFRPAVLQPASNHIQARIALSLGREIGVPVVYEVRGFWEESWSSRGAQGEQTAMETDRYRMTREVETAAMLAADAVVTLSEVMRGEIVARGCDPARVTVVPNAVDIDRFRPRPRDDALASKLGIESGDEVVGYITSLNAYEGIPYLLEAAALLRSRGRRVRVLLVGEGDEEASIRATASRLGLDADGTLIMPGRVPHDAVTGYYSLIDVFVVPRTANRVAQLVTPLKPYEAMALERALVVSDLPALREVVIPGETGLTFRPEDATDLADVLGTLLDDPAQRQALGRRAREWIASERTWARNGQLYRALFERLGVA